MVTTRIKRKVSGEVVRVEETSLMVGKLKVKKVTKPLSPAAKQRKSDKSEGIRLTKENDQILRALALMRDGRCVIPDCPHPLEYLQMSHIYPKGENATGKGGYPLMRWLLPNVEMRCSWHHKYAPGSPHNDAGGFAAWIRTLPTWRTEYLELEAMNKGKFPFDLQFKQSENVRLRQQFFAQTGGKWGE